MVTPPHKRILHTPLQLANKKTVYSIQDNNFVIIHKVGYDMTSLLEPFITHRTLELRIYTILIFLKPYQSFLVLVRSAASICALESGY